MTEKINIESEFAYYATSGCITYVEFSSGLIQNKKAIEKVINYAMDSNIPYFAINFPIDECLSCGYSGEIPHECPQCNSGDIQRLRRVTGYLTTDKSHFNKGKQAEVEDRVKHNIE
jgi:ribonucleoside-triphosphate reductase